jgi:hypothetical protein
VNVELQQFFSGDEIEQLARSCAFVERKSPITGFKFLLTLTTGLLNTPDGSLSQLAAFLSVACRTKVSPQALDERLNVAALAFMKCCLDKAFAMATRPRKLKDCALADFDHVYIIDSTNFGIHPSLRDVFKGSSGSGSPASMRIQLVLDYLTGRLYAQIGDTKLCDAPSLKRIVENHELDVSGRCLFLSDLGYFKCSTFKSITESNQHFLSKLMFGVTFHDERGVKMDLDAILKEEPDSFDRVVFLEGQVYRLVGTRLPDEVVNRRLRTANRKAQKKGKGHGAVTDDYRRFARYAIFLTSLPTTYTMETLYTLYRIRWQIELIFKTWKSILAIHKIRSARTARLMCEVYGKLILAAISSMIAAAAETMPTAIVVSLHRTMKHLQAVALPLAFAIMIGGTALKAFIAKQIEEIARLCRKHRQKNKPSIEMLLQLTPSAKGQNAKPQIGLT